MKMVILPGHKDEGVNPPTPTTKSPNKTGPITQRPRAPALWSVHECQLWIARHCGELGIQYSELFHKNNVNGRSLLLFKNPSALERMGIPDRHRQEIWREIIKLKLKSDILEIRDLESQIASYK